MDEVKIEEVVKGMKNLPTLPGVAIKIMEAVNKEATSLKELAEILSKDPPLSGKVLAVINSAFYSLPVKVTSVPHAVNLLGINTVKKLALSFSLLRIFKKESTGDFDYVEFWKGSLIAAISARLFAQKMLPALAEDAFTIGLLHNIGILTINESMPKQYSLVNKERKGTLCGYHEGENQIIGFNHMELGGYLVDTWGLPETFSEPIRHHHCPETLKSDKADIAVLTKVLHLASLVIDFFTLTEKSFSLGALEIHAKEYGYSDEPQIEELIKQVHKQAMAIFPLFEMTFEEERDYFEIIEDARSALIHLSNRGIKELVEQKKQIGMLREQAMRDSLTNLLNYKSFHYALNKECYRAKRYNVPLVLIIADIDHFKKVNDTYGHQAGDHVLVTVAQELSKSLRNSDSIARHGGEEFGIILPETTLDNAIVVADRLRHAVESLPIEYAGNKMSITVSFGIASLSSEGGITKEELIGRADAAVYRAKSSGKNRCCVFDGSKPGTKAQSNAKIRVVK